MLSDNRGPPIYQQFDGNGRPFFIAPLPPRRRAINIAAVDSLSLPAGNVCVCVVVGGGGRGKGKERERE